MPGAAAQPTAPDTRVAKPVSYTVSDGATGALLETGVITPMEVLNFAPFDASAQQAPVPDGNNDTSRIGGYGLTPAGTPLAWRYEDCYGLDSKRPNEGNRERLDIFCYAPVSATGYTTPTYSVVIRVNTVRGVLKHELTSNGQVLCAFILTDRGDGDVNKQAMYVLCTTKILLPDDPRRVGLPLFLSQVAPLAEPTDPPAQP
jgi:hypothetical protein